MCLLGKFSREQAQQLPTTPVKRDLMKSLFTIIYTISFSQACIYGRISRYDFDKIAKIGYIFGKLYRILTPLTLPFLNFTFMNTIF